MKFLITMIFVCGAQSVFSASDARKLAILQNYEECLLEAGIKNLTEIINSKRYLEYPKSEKVTKDNVEELYKGLSEKNKETVEIFQSGLRDIQEQIDDYSIGLPRFQKEKIHYHFGPVMFGPKYVLKNPNPEYDSFIVTMHWSSAPQCKFLMSIAKCMIELPDKAKSDVK